MDTRNPKISPSPISGRRRCYTLVIPLVPPVIQEAAPAPVSAEYRNSLLQSSDYLRRHPELLDHLLE